jgi:DNA-binding MarR family transcriptional regulator
LNPDVNKTQTLTDSEIAARLRLVVMRLARRLRQQAPAGVTPSQLSALATLSAKGPMTLGALAEAERVRPPSMTRIVVALEEDELVAREQDPDDRRRATVRLTERGRKLIASNRTRKTAYLAQRMTALSEDERQTLARASEVLERMLEERS